MKKLFILMLVFIMGISLAGCSKKDEQNANMPNPVVQYESLEEINKIAQTNIVSPAVMGKENEKYSVISNKVAQYNVDINGYEFTIRGAKETTEDISGIYDDKNIFAPNVDQTNYLNDYFVHRFFIDKTQYTIVLVRPDDMERTTFDNICEEIEDGIKGPSGKKDYSGNYIDIVSQRATMEISKGTESDYDIVVSWSSSASITTEWHMHANKEVGKLSYAGEEIYTTEYDENGDVISKEMTAANNLGYFTIDGPRIRWEGAAQEECRECIFELQEENH